VRRFQAAIVSRLKDPEPPRHRREALAPGRAHPPEESAGREIDVRVSVIPMLHGEAVVLRILDSGGAMRTMDAIGNGRRDRSAFEKSELPHGIILVMAPARGRTRRFTRASRAFNQIDRKIITIEDPVEYQLPGVNQIRSRPRPALTFAPRLRARILRHDPERRA